jgi:hypothetical protein
MKSLLVITSAYVFVLVVEETFMGFSRKAIVCTIRMSRKPSTSSTITYQNNDADR